jgi:hypothetical protein
MKTSTGRIKPAEAAAAPSKVAIGPSTMYASLPEISTFCHLFSTISPHLRDMFWNVENY